MAKVSRVAIDVNDGITYTNVSIRVLKSFKFLAILTIRIILIVLKTDKVLLRLTPVCINFDNTKEVTIPKSTLTTMKQSTKFQVSLK